MEMTRYDMVDQDWVTVQEEMHGNEVSRAPKETADILQLIIQESTNRRLAKFRRLRQICGKSRGLFFYLSFFFFPLCTVVYCRALSSPSPGLLAFEPQRHQPPAAARKRE